MKSHRACCGDPLSGSLLKAGLHDWRLWAAPAQTPPPQPWRTWVFLGGRGAGKTRAGAEWVRDCVRSGRAGRFALIGPTFHDVREVMVEGVSGVRAFGGDRPVYEASRRRLAWANGAVAHCFSAEDPESLRGPQFDAAWADELCFWHQPEATLAILAHAMRLGDRPAMMVTTTPRPIPALKCLTEARDTVVTRASTWENARHLSGDFIEALRQRWSGSAHQRQELLGEVVDELDGALWRRGQLERLRQPCGGPFDYVVVAIDPPAGVGGSACGIVAAGRVEREDGPHAVVLADASISHAEPMRWATIAVELARSLKADAIVAEANNGGEMVRAVLHAAAPDVFVRLVRASDSKRLRAEPMAAYYAQGRITHAAAFAELEDEMCAFGADGQRTGADRVDALVWALSDLFKCARPRVSAL